MIYSWLPIVDFHGMMKFHIIVQDFFMHSLFLNMKPDYTYVSKFYRVGKDRTYEREGAFHDPLFPNPTPHLVPRP